MLVLDGESREVDVDLSGPTVRVGSHEFPIRLETAADGSVSFEIEGERVEVRPADRGSGGAGDAITINGELHTLVLRSAAGTRPRALTSGAGAATPREPSSVSTPGGPGQAVHSPMPGKVLEVRVREGETVRAGQVLLVVEAMKMRNDVTAPGSGTVASLMAAPGMNVSARDVLLRVVAP